MGKNNKRKARRAEQRKAAEAGEKEKLIKSATETAVAQESKELKPKWKLPVNKHRHCAAGRRNNKISAVRTMLESWSGLEPMLIVACAEKPNTYVEYFKQTDEGQQGVEEGMIQFVFVQPDMRPGDAIAQSIISSQVLKGNREGKFVASFSPLTLEDYLHNHDMVGTGKMWLALHHVAYYIDYKRLVTEVHRLGSVFDIFVAVSVHRFGHCPTLPSNVKAQPLQTSEASVEVINGVAFMRVEGGDVAPYPCPAGQLSFLDADVDAGIGRCISFERTRVQENGGNVEHLYVGKCRPCTPGAEAVAVRRFLDIDYKSPWYDTTCGLFGSKKTVSLEEPLYRLATTIAYEQKKGVSRTFIAKKVSKIIKDSGREPQDEYRQVMLAVEVMQRDLPEPEMASGWSFNRGRRRSPWLLLAILLLLFLSFGVGFAVAAPGDRQCYCEKAMELTGHNGTHTLIEFSPGVELEIDGAMESRSCTAAARQPVGPRIDNHRPLYPSLGPCALVIGVLERTLGGPELGTLLDWPQEQSDAWNAAVGRMRQHIAEMTQNLSDWTEEFVESWIRHFSGVRPLEVAEFINVGVTAMSMSYALNLFTKDEPVNLKNIDEGVDQWNLKAPRVITGCRAAMRSMGFAVSWASKQLTKVFTYGEKINDVEIIYCVGDNATGEATSAWLEKHNSADYMFIEADVERMDRDQCQRSTIATYFEGLVPPQVYQMLVKASNGFTATKTFSNGTRVRVKTDHGMGSGEPPTSLSNGMYSATVALAISEMTNVKISLLLSGDDLLIAVPVGTETVIEELMTSGRLFGFKYKVKVHDSVYKAEFCSMNPVPAVSPDGAIVPVFCPKPFRSLWKLGYSNVEEEQFADVAAGFLHIALAHPLLWAIYFPHATNLESAEAPQYKIKFDDPLRWTFARYEFADDELFAISDAYFTERYGYSLTDPAVMEVIHQATTPPFVVADTPFIRHCLAVDGVKC